MIRIENPTNEKMAQLTSFMIEHIYQMLDPTHRVTITYAIHEYNKIVWSYEPELILAYHSYQRPIFNGLKNVRWLEIACPQTLATRFWLKYRDE